MAVVTQEKVRRPLRILLAVDDEAMSALLIDSLKGNKDCEIIRVANENEFYYRMDQWFSDNDQVELNRRIDIVVSDICLPGKTFVDIWKDYQRLSGAPPIILLTAFSERQEQLIASKLGVYAVFDKPFDIYQFTELIQLIKNRWEQQTTV